jgi:hypothetical protein
MNGEEQVPDAGTPAAQADAEITPVERLNALGVRGILWQLARDGQLIDVRCEKLNAEKIPTIHGTNRWTAASVRKAFVS